MDGDESKVLKPCVYSIEIDGFECHAMSCHVLLMLLL